MTGEKSQSINFSYGNVIFSPQEEMLEIGKKQKKLTIGIPREKSSVEKRVALTPEAVEILVNQGHDIIIESKAGEGANYSNTDYSERGGYIEENREKVFQADIILKVAPLTREELNLVKGKQTVISSLHLTSQTEEYIRKLMQLRMTAIAFENIRDEHHHHPVVRSMSSIAGTTSVLIAGELLSNAQGGKGVMLGGITGITPTEIVIIGAGTAAEYAVRAALGLGASVKIFDNSVNRLNQIQNAIGHPLHTSVFHPKVLSKSLKSADVVIGAIHIEEGGPRFYVTEEQVKKMKKGSVIIDISIDQGGCVETSECRTLQDAVFTKHGVIHYSVVNFPSRVARTASIALSNVLLPLLIEVANAGGIHKKLKHDIGVRHGVYVFNGLLTNRFMGEHFNIPTKDIDLLMAAF